MNKPKSEVKFRYNQNGQRRAAKIRPTNTGHHHWMTVNLRRAEHLLKVGEAIEIREKFDA